MKTSDKGHKDKSGGTTQRPDPRTELRDYTMLVCPKHGIPYPKGSTCPKCREEG